MPSDYNPLTSLSARRWEREYLSTSRHRVAEGQHGGFHVMSPYPSLLTPVMPNSGSDGEISLHSMEALGLSRVHLDSDVVEHVSFTTDVHGLHTPLAEAQRLIPDLIGCCSFHLLRPIVRLLGLD